MGTVRSFTELVAWQKAREVRRSILRLVRSWAIEEKFRLSDQIIRSSRGACANIAEGYGRSRGKDNIRFCRIAKGSLYETQDHLSAAYDEGFLDVSALKVHWSIVEEALRVINGYINYLQTFTESTSVSEPSVDHQIASQIFTDGASDLPDNWPRTTDN